MLPRGSGSIFFTGCDGRRQRIRPLVVGVRHGQVRFAWTRAESCTGTRSRGNSCRALRHRLSTGTGRRRAGHVHCASDRAFLHGGAGATARRVELGDGVAQPFRALLIARTGLDRLDGEKGTNELGKDAFAMLGFEHVRCAFGGRRKARRSRQASLEVSGFRTFWGSQFKGWGWITCGSRNR
jgi:hypothetical protein